MKGRIIGIVMLTLVTIMCTVYAVFDNKNSESAQSTQYLPAVNVTAQCIRQLPMQSLEVTADSFAEIVNNTVNDVYNSVNTEDVLRPAYTEEQREILAVIIYQEAGGDVFSDDTRLKVGSVFLNRVNSSLFPDTFEEVALQNKQYGTLCWTGIKWPDRSTHEEEAHAVKRAYDIAEELLVNGSVLPDNVIWQAEFQQGDGIYCYQDNFYFCYSEVSE